VTGGLSLVADLIQNQPNQPGTTFDSAAFLLIWNARWAMYEATVLQEKAQMFEQRAENAIEPISKQHFKEMAAHYRSLAVEHLAFKHDERAY
jgi:hypothetical protein